MVAQAIRRVGSFMVVAAALAFASAALAKDQLPEVSTDGLHLVKQTEFAAVYVKPGATLAGYDKVAILQCFVAFQKNWQQNMNAQTPLSVTPEDIQKIKQKLSAEFMKVFSAQLTAGGYPVVDDAAADVLVLRPAIVNLQMQAPNPMGTPGEVFAQSAGQMTLYLELYDSITSDLIARVIDPEEARNLGGGFGWQTSGSNLTAADEILKKWADTLRSYLEQARGQG
jgi:Protein of unknown function (DUF3313)